ncbi:hypothetical protein [Thalassolituus maritimus]|uniref:LRAT domain-containing protein n=1 Tax=Thalassolituus maritimus TaxID=484498 RepID=A0ABP9ZZH2_9GAMM
MKVHKNIPEHPCSVEILSRPKAGAGELVSVVHQGVKFTYPCGQILVVHITPNEGLCVASFDEFEANLPVSSVHVDERHHIGAVQRANALLMAEKTYSVLTLNCQHVTSFIATGDAQSKELQSVAIGSGLGYLLGATAFKTQSLAIKVGFTIAGGLIGQLLFKKSKLKGTPAKAPSALQI